MGFSVGAGVDMLAGEVMASVADVTSVPARASVGAINCLVTFGTAVPVDDKIALDDRMVAV